MTDPVPVTKESEFSSAAQGLTKEEILAAHPNDAQIDMVMYIEDIILTNARAAASGLTLEEKQAVATKMAYWCRMFYSQGCLKFQMAYEKKVKELAEKKLQDSLIDRKKLIVPFKYRGKKS